MAAVNSEDRTYSPKIDEAQKAAEKVDVTGQINPEIKPGTDKEFNSWVRKAHEVGNPEQLSPMQANQNEIDRNTGPLSEPENRIDDPNHEDTRWVAANVKGESLDENSKTSKDK